MALLQKIRNNITIVKNTGYLSIIEVIRIVMPFVALPYILRTVGAENYGIAIFAQTAISYFSILINFGLDISAVKDVSVNRENKEELNRIVSAVLGIKLLLFLVSAAILFLFLFFVPFFVAYRSLVLFAFLTCVTDLLFPVWFYQGIEKMKYLTLIRTTSILFYTVSVFLFVKKPDDYGKIVLLQSLGNVLSGLLSVWLLLKVNHVRIVMVNVRYMCQKFKESIPFFLSRLSVELNDKMAKTVSGIFFSMDLVAAFDLAQKICRVALVPMQMLNQAAYPHIAKTLDTVFVRKFLSLNVVLSLVVAVAVCMVAPLAIKIFAGNQLPEAVDLTRILSLWVFFGGITTYIGAPVLVSFGHSAPFNNSVILSSVVLLVLYGIMYLVNMVSIYNFAIILCMAELVILIFRFFYCAKYRIIILEGWRK